MSFQWDSKKRRENLAKHKVDFADATAVLEDPGALTRDDPHPREDRFVTLGMDTLGRILVVSWTARGEEFRLISARKATRDERAQYGDDK